MKLFLLSIFLVAVAVAEEEYKDIEVTLKPSDGPVSIESPNYPEDAPANLKNRYIITAPEGKKVKLEFSDIRLFLAAPCGAWGLIIMDGDNIVEEFCDTTFHKEIISETNKVTLKLRTGGADRGFMACKAMAV